MRFYRTVRALYVKVLVIANSKDLLGEDNISLLMENGDTLDEE